MTETTESTGLISIEEENRIIEGQLLQKGLSVLQKKFCRLIATEELNNTQCYLDTFNPNFRKKNNRDLTRKVASSLSNCLLSKVEICNYVDYLQAQAAQVADVTVNSVIQRHKEIADFDVRKIFEWQRIELFDKYDESFNPPKYRMELTAKNMEDIPPEAWNVIESVSQGRDGFIIKLASKQKALESLGKWLGIDKQIVEQQGNINLTFDKDDAEL